MNNSWAREAVSGRDQAEEEVKWTAHRGVDGREDRGASDAALSRAHYYFRINQTHATTSHSAGISGQSCHVMDVTH